DTPGAPRWTAGCLLWLGRCLAGCCWHASAASESRDRMRRAARSLTPRCTPASTIVAPPSERPRARSRGCPITASAVERSCSDTAVGRPPDAVPAAIVPSSVEYHEVYRRRWGPGASPGYPLATTLQTPSRSD